MIPKKKFLAKNNVNSYKKEASYYFTFNYPGLSDDDKNLHDLQIEQENQRLIYVALTRAVYKCYISFMPRTYNKKPEKSSFDDLFEKFDRSNAGIELIDLSEGKFQKITGQYTNKDGGTKTFQPRTPKLTTDDVKVPILVHSFSALNHLHPSALFQKQDQDDKYDQFIFQQLGRGATVGTALHSIFEYLQFDQPDTWEQTLTDAAQYYKGIIKEEMMHHFKTLVEHTMKADIPINDKTLQLVSVADRQKLAEMQFNFSMNGVEKKKIDELLGEAAELSGEASLQGLMTGFIDLIIKHEGKYYILDWKSNHLGNNLDDYNEEGLNAAMKGSNYNLQYLIYTLAVKRWLAGRIPDFDYDTHFGGVIYLFLRGIRKGKNTGIFTDKPSKELMEQLDELLLRLKRQIP
jgi:exodeoxyribonuclease V beta subunit